MSLARIKAIKPIIKSYTNQNLKIKTYEKKVIKWNF